VSVEIHDPPAEMAEVVRRAISSALPEAEVEVTGANGHFQIRVLTREFAGKNRLARQRMVYRAIADLMQGDFAPVHAVDRLDTLTPDEI
jgi:acid stress-induced BolA-like protein IbaG/YrbA